MENMLWEEETNILSGVYVSQNLVLFLHYLIFALNFPTEKKKKRENEHNLVHVHGGYRGQTEELERTKNSDQAVVCGSG